MMSLKPCDLLPLSLLFHLRRAHVSCLPLGDDIQRETSPFINSDNDSEQSYDGKNMALFEVGQK